MLGRQKQPTSPIRSQNSLQDLSSLPVVHSARLRESVSEIRGSSCDIPKPQTTLELKKTLPIVTERPCFRKNESKVELGIEKNRKQQFSVNCSETDDKQKLFVAEK